MFASRGLECHAAAALGLGGPALSLAEQSARTVTELSPYRESAYAILTEALERQGNIAEALQVYERIRALLGHGERSYGDSRNDHEAWRSAALDRRSFWGTSWRRASVRQPPTHTPSASPVVATAPPLCSDGSSGVM